MNEYVVGINLEDVIHAEDEIEAIAIFKDSVSWLDFYAIKIESEASPTGEEVEE